MSLKENLKKKILVDGLFKSVSLSIGTPGTPRKLDKEGMRLLLNLSPFVLKTERDLELYYREGEPGKTEILVLDNELPLYVNTTIDDVGLRKSPELKEMVSIRNIIKILNDSDVVLCKGKASLVYVYERALELLDFRFDEKDIDEIFNAGIQALGASDSDAVLETLDLFVELLGYESVPAEAMANDYVMFGRRQETTAGLESFGPIIMYNDRINVLKAMKGPVPTTDPVAVEMIPKVAMGEMEPDAEGYEAFRFLKQEAMKKKNPTLH